MCYPSRGNNSSSFAFQLRPVDYRTHVINTIHHSSTVAFVDSSCHTDSSFIVLHATKVCCSCTSRIWDLLIDTVCLKSSKKLKFKYLCKSAVVLGMCLAFTLDNPVYGKFSKDNFVSSPLRFSFWPKYILDAVNVGIDIPSPINRITFKATSENRFYLVE